MKVLFLLFLTYASFLFSETEAKIFSPMRSSHEVLALGGAIADYFLEINESEFKKLDLQKGGWKAADLKEIQMIIFQSKQKAETKPGGSAVNVLKGLTSLGRKCAILGKIGNDKVGKKYRETLERKKIRTLFSQGDLPTGRILCLVTPDGERTMLAYQGAAYANVPMKLNPSDFESARLFHAEGYEILNFELLENSMKMAKENRTLISLDLGNFQIVQKHKEKFLYLLENYVDIVFANQSEAKAISGMAPMDACCFLSKMCDIAIVTMGSGGGWVKQKKHYFYYPSIKARTKDTTGAGDLFSSGFLHGYLKGLSLEKCAWMGAYIASKVVETIGAEMSDSLWEDITSRFRVEDEMAAAELAENS